MLGRMWKKLCHSPASCKMAARWAWKSIRSLEIPPIQGKITSSMLTKMNYNSYLNSTHRLSMVFVKRRINLTRTGTKYRRKPKPIQSALNQRNIASKRFPRHKSEAKNSELKHRHGIMWHLPRVMLAYICKGQCKIKANSHSLLNGNSLIPGRGFARHLLQQLFHHDGGFHLGVQAG
jgi:hypothetical protein